MAFFDKITKSVSEASQKTVNKTKELADTAKLNSGISAEEKKLNNLYLQIGKLYVDLHREDYEEAFAEKIADVNAAEETIRDLKQQIRDIKGVQTCANCGADVAPGSAFCTSCGNEMPKILQPAATVSVGAPKCTKCGNTIQKGMRFCTSCGTPVQAAAPEAAPAEEVPAGKACPNCGAMMEDGMSFCTECGTAL